MAMREKQLNARAISDCLCLYLKPCVDMTYLSNPEMTRACGNSYAGAAMRITLRTIYSDHGTAWTARAGDNGAVNVGKKQQKATRRGWRERRQRRKLARELRGARIPFRFWQHALSELRACNHLDAPQRRRLRALCGRFLAQTRFSGARGYPVDDRMRLIIAILGCLPALELGLSALRGVREVVVYGGTFVVDRETEDEAGVVHEERTPMAGEAWEQGPVILSWGDIVAARATHGLDEGLVLHEFVHKLDMLSGDANGQPPLHREMDRRAWQRDFQAAFDDLNAALDRGEETALDPYGAESPAEFFSVCGEAFFLAPDLLKSHYPAIYEQLAAFFRQRP